MSLIMPKHTRGEYEHLAVLKVHVDKNTWVSSSDLIAGLHAEYVRLGKETSIKTDKTDYTKDAQIPRYFLLIRRNNPANKSSPTIITPEGRRFYQSLLANDFRGIQEILVDRICTLTFGRNTQGCGSDSDIEPLGALFRAIYDLDGITNAEYGYLLQELDRQTATYSSILSKIRAYRIAGGQPPTPLGSQASNLKDWKVVLFLTDMQLLYVGTDGRTRVTGNVDRFYHERLHRLPLTNVSLMKVLFKQWLAENNYGVSVDTYPRSIEAVSMPLSSPMSKTTGSWEGLYEYIFGNPPQVKSFEVSGSIDYLRVYSRLNSLLNKDVRPPIPLVDPIKHQELVDYTLHSGASIDKGRLYCANNAYKKFLHWLNENKLKEGISYTEEEVMINKYLAAIRTKPFALLAGISGTGKSRLVRQLARGCCPDGHELGKDKQGTVNAAKKPGNFEMIPVRPNWHDSTELLGYVTRITEDNKPKYVLTPFVKFLAKAWMNEDVPFFLCLDEMNLAPVEQYFAEYLSVIESRQKNAAGKIETDVLIRFDVAQSSPGNGTSATTDNFVKETVDALLEKELASPDQQIKTKAQALHDEWIKDQGLRVPQNLVVMGTVNMDETTCTFSRKVLDRAMSFELNVDEVMYSAANLAGEGDMPYGAIDVSAAKGEILAGNDAYAALGQADGDKILAYIKALNDAMKNTQFKIAYRSRNEILTYCRERTKNGQVALREALDEVTSMKILSRVEGDDQKFSKFKLKEFLSLVVLELLKIDNAAATANDVATFLGNAADVEKSPSASKLKRMADDLEAGVGFVSYWEC